LEVREVRSVLIIVISSNRGLCGSFNTQVFKKIKQELLDPSRMMVNRVGEKRIESKVSPKELKIDFLTIGRKGENMIRRMSKNIIAKFEDLMFTPKVEEVRTVAKIAMDDYLAKKYDKVVVVYTDYISAINQQTRIRQILPISKIDLEKQIAEMDTMAKEYGLKEPSIEYKVEPSPKEILEFIFPRLIEMQIYHAVLESNASKESARMMAMRSATDAAGEMVNGLTLMYNQIRQQKITQEIAEISAGRAALEN
jgi:F-type H+-transporting ATPase subunit gamma